MYCILGGATPKLGIRTAAFLFCVSHTFSHALYILWGTKLMGVEAYRMMGGLGAPVMCYIGEIRRMSGEEMR